VVADERCLPDLRDALAGTDAGGGRPRGGDRGGGERRGLDDGAIVGCAGLEPAMAAIANGGTVVLANKEPLVSAGEVVLAAAEKAGATLLPADSEHNAIYQCFDFARPERVRRIVLTASGGPFGPGPPRPCVRSLPNRRWRIPTGRWARRSRSIRRR
jgi:1-deoxy-D-xylulose-5-phosphate reductoisomerase